MWDELDRPTLGAYRCALVAFELAYHLSVNQSGLVIGCSRS